MMKDHWRRKLSLNLFLHQYYYHLNILAPGIISEAGEFISNVSSGY